MFPSNSSGLACDGAVDGDTLTAGLLITTTATGGDKGKRCWRLVRYVLIGVFISRKKSHHYRTEGSPEPDDAVTEQPLLLDSSSAASAQAQPHIVIEVSSPPPPPVVRREPWDTIVRIVEERDLNSLQKLGGVKGVQSVLLHDQTTRFQEEDVVDDGHGGQDPQARITISSTNSFSYFLRRAFYRHTIFLLLVSAGLCFAIDIIKEQGPKNGWYNGIAILIATFVLVFCPSIKNYRRERKIAKKLLKDFNKEEVKVVRNGKSLLLSIPQVLVRDTVYLVKGDRVPADGLFLGSGEEEVEYLVLDEVLNSNIDMNRNPFLYAGSKVVEGSGRMVVTSIGANTAWGDEVLSLVSAHDYSNKKTILQSVVDKSYGHIDNLTLCVTVLISFEVLIRLLVFGELDSDDNELPELKGEVSLKFVVEVFERVLLKPQGKVSILVSILVTVVVGIQHGMPIVIAVSHCRWKEKLELSQVDARNLSACGSMGLVTVIFLDATGDLICNKMEVKEFWIGEENILSSAEMDSETDQSVIEALHRGIGFLNDLSVSSPTTDFLISWMKCRWNLNMDFSNTNFNILEYKRLSCSKKVSGVLIRKGTEEDNDQEEDHIMHLHWKGAASTIMEMCSHFYDSRGEKHAMEDQKQFFKKVITEMEEKGVRPIAFACGQTGVEELKEDGLDLLAIVGVKYLCREETISVVDDLRKAGVIVKLVSEDELSAVRNIAWELGFFKKGSNDVATEGKEIREMVRTESARIESVDLATVIGSSLPRDKFLMVDYSQRKGHVVAFYGGLSTSDAQALKKADIAITEEIRCTEKAREFSDISIRDVSSLRLIFKHGRCAYHNTQKFFQLQLTALISGLILALVATLHSGDSPLKALHLIWMNLILCLVGGFMMVMDLQGQELQHTSQPAKSRTQLLASKVMCKNVAIQVSYQTCVFFIFEFGGDALPFIEEDVRKTMIFNIFILCQLFNHFNIMELEKKEVFEVVLHSYCFLVALGAAMVMQILVIEFGNDIISCERLNAPQWTYCVLFAALSWGFDRAIKQLSAYRPSFSLASELAEPFPNRRPFLPYASYLGFPIFSMILLVSASYYSY